MVGPGQKPLKGLAGTVLPLKSFYKTESATRSYRAEMAPDYLKKIQGGHPKSALFSKLPRQNVGMDLERNFRIALFMTSRFESLVAMMAQNPAFIAKGDRNFCVHP